MNKDGKLDFVSWVLILIAVMIMGAAAKLDSTGLYVFGIVGMPIIIFLQIYKKGLFTFLAVIGIIGVGIYYLIAGISGKLNPYLQAGLQVCDSKPLSESRMYSNTAGTHPIIVINGKKDVDENEYPAGWYPTDVQDTELIACIENTSWESIETCEYFGTSISTIARLQHKMVITVKIAQTAEIIDTITITGGLPDACPKTALFDSNGESRRYYGDEVQFRQVMENLRSFVTP